MASMTLTDPIVQPSRGTVDQVYDFAVEQGAQRLPFLRDYLEESWRLSEIDGIDFSEMSAQSAHETGNWAGKGFENNTNWTELGNPAGLAITNSENKSVNYKSGTDAARAHHVHMWLYRYGPLKPGDALYQYRDLDGHYTEAATGTNTYSTNKPYAASVKTLADFQPNGQWALLLPYPAAGDRYGDRIVKKAKEIWGNDLKVEDPPVTTPSTPEEPGEQETPVAAEVEILSMLIGPQSNAPATLLNRNGKVRPIGHNTDNPSKAADAIMHAKFVASGGGTGGVSFHWAIDSKRAVQILPMDRIGYHASDGCDNRQTDTGCYDGVAFENCDNADGDIRKTFDNFCRVIARIEWGQDPRINYGTMPKEFFKGFIDRLLGHHDVAYDAKWCPQDFMDLYGEDGWKVEARKRAHAYLAELQGMTPAEPAEPTTPVYATPDKPAAGTWATKGGTVFIGVDEEVTIRQKVTPRKYAEPDQPATGPDLAVGTKLTITHIVVASDNKPWLIVADGSRIPAAALVAA